MDTLAALEAALRKTPDDPLLLNAITDYFLDRDDPRGEFLQLARRADAGMTSLPTVEWHALRKQAEAVLNRHPAAMLGPLVVIGDDLTVTLWHLCWPMRVVVRNAEAATFATVAASPLVKWLEVSPRGDLPGDAGVERLLASGVVSRLVVLTMNGCGITDDGALALAADPAVAALRSLRLSANQISPIGLDALAAAGHQHVGSQNMTPWLDSADTAGAIT